MHGDDRVIIVDGLIHDKAVGRLLAFKNRGGEVLFSRFPVIQSKIPLSNKFRSQRSDQCSGEKSEKEKKRIANSETKNNESGESLLTSPMIRLETFLLELKIKRSAEGTSA